MVAGLACDKSSTSNSILMPGVSEILSPLARQSTLESSSTVLRFSTQMVSTGPSSTIHCQSVGEPSTLCGSMIGSSLSSLRAVPCSEPMPEGVLLDTVDSVAGWMLDKEWDCVPPNVYTKQCKVLMNLRRLVWV